jgi:hypothetical protein
VALKTIEKPTTAEEAAPALPAPSSAYHRYHIDTAEAPDIVPWPSRFKVRVGKVGLATLLLKELLHTRDLEVTTSRPCIYGVFSGPVGGFAPIEEKCVGCLRCMTEHPDFVRVEHNPERQKLGDSYFTAGYVNAVAYEAAGGRVPVRGAGYRGRFGGQGWDGMWTDMSEIVRPTRDGIHGREFISTVVDIGHGQQHLFFDDDGTLPPTTFNGFSLSLPLLFDAPPERVGAPQGVAMPLYRQILADTARAIDSLAFLPLPALLDQDLRGDHIAPLLSAADVGELDRLAFAPRLVCLDGWDEALLAAVRLRWPETPLALRLFDPPEATIHQALEAGIRIFHITADYHGRGRDGVFIFDIIRRCHLSLVQAGRRDEVTLLGSGGIIAAEHVPKAIIAGLDAVVLDTAPLVALQAQFDGDFVGRDDTTCRLPAALTADWGVQRLKNLSAAWRDQLLEILGAMGLREVRRLRGEMGRAIFMEEQEREAFAGIEGYDG